MDYESNPLVKSFLDHACRKIFSKSSQQEVKRELLTHIEESIESKISSGMSIEQAIAQTLSDLGSPTTLANELSVAHRPIYFQLPFLTAAVAIIGVIGTFLMIDLTHRAFEQSALKSLEVEQTYQQRFFEDQKSLTAIPFFEIPGRKNDAGMYLNGRLAWMGENSFLKYFPKDPPLAIASDLFIHLPAKDWVSYQGGLPQLDTQWMSELKKYDHWDLFESGPLLALLKDHPEQPFLTLPLPSISSLAIWTKLRLLQGIREKKVISALKEVRQVARLSRTTEILLGEMVGVAILRQELDTYNYSVAHGLLKASDWQPLSDETLIRARRSIYGFTQFFDIWTDPEVLEKVFDSHTARAGICSALMEGISRGSLYRGLLETSTPLEEDFSPRFASLDAAVERSVKDCRFNSTFLKTWRDPDRTREWIKPEDVSVGPPSIWTKIEYRYLIRVPVLRRLILARLQSAVPPDYLSRPYQSLLPGETALAEIH